MSNLMNPFWHSTNPFIVEWTVSASDTVILPLKSGELYNFTVDWDDGSPLGNVTSFNDPDATHTYSGGGSFDVKITGSMDFWDTNFASASDRLRITDIIQWGNVNAEAILFRFCSNFVASATDTPIESNASPHIQKFRDTAITSINNIDQWNFDNDCNNMFLNASSYNQDLSGVDFTNTTDLTSFLDGTSFNTTNYDLLLIALDAHASLQSTVTMGVGTTKYSAGAAATARANIISNHTWTINDGGQV